VYQTLDGTDGKQARRLRCGSALGEIFDHGCDAVTTTIYASFCSEILDVGLDSTIGALFVLHAQAAFFFSNLTLIHFERQDIQLLDSQEMQALIQSGALINFFAPTIMALALPIPNTMVQLLRSCIVALPSKRNQPFEIQIRALLVIIGLATPFIHGITTSLRILRYYRTNAYAKKAEAVIEKSEKSRPTGRGISGFLVQTGIFSVWYVTSVGVHHLLVRTKSGNLSLIAWLIVCGLGFGDLMNRTLVQRVAHTKLLNTPLDLPGMIGMVLIISLTLARVRGTISMQQMYIGCLGTALSTAVLYLQYVVDIGDTICRVLNVSWFCVPPEKQEEARKREEGKS